MKYYIELSIKETKIIKVNFIQERNKNQDHPGQKKNLLVFVKEQNSHLPFHVSNNADATFLLLDCTGKLHELVCVRGKYLWRTDCTVAGRLASCSLLSTQMGRLPNTAGREFRAPASCNLSTPN